MSRAVLLGGEPLGEDLVLWWNFVGRSRADIDTAHHFWQDQDDRFGRVSATPTRVPASRVALTGRQQPTPKSLMRERSVRALLLWWTVGITHPPVEGPHIGHVA